MCNPCSDVYWGFPSALRSKVREGVLEADFEIR